MSLLSHQEENEHTPAADVLPWHCLLDAASPRFGAGNGDLDRTASALAASLLSPSSPQLALPSTARAISSLGSSSFGVCRRRLESAVLSMWTDLLRLSVAFEPEKVAVSVSFQPSAAALHAILPAPHFAASVSSLLTGDNPAASASALLLLAKRGWGRREGQDRALERICEDDEAALLNTSVWTTRGGSLPHRPPPTTLFNVKTPEDLPVLLTT